MYYVLFIFEETQPTQEEIVKCVNKATQSLWTQTGATLEHVILWWCYTPLACEPVAAARHLRDWLLNMQYDGDDFLIFFSMFSSNELISLIIFYLQKTITEAPETLVSILRCLGETLTVHVAYTTYDSQFGYDIHQTYI